MVTIRVVETTADQPAITVDPIGATAEDMIVDARKTTIPVAVLQK